MGWRLAWQTGCATHGCSLVDRCPACGKPQQLRHLRADAPHLAACAACGADLRKAATSPCRTDALEFQQAGDRTARTGGNVCFGEDVDAAEWFATADFLCGLVRRALRSPTTGLMHLLGAAGIEWPPRLQAAPGARIELLSAHDRQALLGAVQRVMRLDRDALHRALESSGISRQGLLGSKDRLPDALGAAVPPLPDRARTGRRRPARARADGPRPHHEVREMMKRLQRKLKRTEQ